MYKDRGSDKLYSGPVWDYDLAFDNDVRTYQINNLWDYIYATNGSVASESVRSMVTRIVKEDAAARARLVELWNEACQSGGIDEASLVEYVERQRVLLEESQEINFKRWDILSTQVHQNPKALGSYDAEVDDVVRYIKSRLTKLDELIKRE